MPYAYKWFLLIDHNYKPNFGDPFSEWVPENCSVHDLKMKLKDGDNKSDFSHCPANRLRIWKCKTLKLSHKDPLYRLNELLSNIRFSDGEDSDVQLLAAGQTMEELGLKDDELLLVVAP